MLGAVVFGHQQMQTAIQAINELADMAAKPAWDWKPAPKDEALVSRIGAIAEADLRAAFKLRQKQARSAAIDNIWKTGVQRAGRRGRPGTGCKHGEGHLLCAGIEDRAHADPGRRAAH